MPDALQWAVAKHKKAPIMGTREIIAELDEVQANGRMFKKYDLGDYRYIYPSLSQFSNTAFEDQWAC